MTAILFNMCDNKKELLGSYHISSIKKKKSDLTLIEINVICEVPFYFMNIKIIDKII